MKRWSCSVTGYSKSDIRASSSRQQRLAEVSACVWLSIPLPLAMQVSTTTLLFMHLFLLGNRYRRDHVKWVWCRLIIECHINRILDFARPLFSSPLQGRRLVTEIANERVMGILMRTDINMLVLMHAKHYVSVYHSSTRMLSSIALSILFAIPLSLREQSNDDL